MGGHAEDPQSRFIRAAWTRFLIVFVGVGVVLLVVFGSILPWPIDAAVEQFMLPQYEVEFGFRGGRLPVGEGDTTYHVYALVTVVPGGTLATAGAKSGDVPIGYHGGIAAFYGALRSAESGEEGRFDVVAHDDWRNWERHRTIVLSPLGQKDVSTE